MAQISNAQDRGLGFICHSQSVAARVANDALDEGADLAVTTDYRAVLSEILVRHMATPDTAAIFPDFTAKLPGLWR